MTHKTIDTVLFHFKDIYQPEIKHGIVDKRFLRFYKGGNDESIASQRIGDKVFAVAILEALNEQLSDDTTVDVIGSNSICCNKIAPSGSRIHALHIRNRSGLNIILDLGGRGGTRIRDKDDSEYYSSSSAGSNITSFLSRQNQFVISLSPRIVGSHALKLVLNNQSYFSIIPDGDHETCDEFRASFCQTLLLKFQDKLNYHPNRYEIQNEVYQSCDYTAALKRVLEAFKTKLPEYLTPTRISRLHQSLLITPAKKVEDRRDEVQKHVEVTIQKQQPTQKSPSFLGKLCGIFSCCKSKQSNQHPVAEDINKETTRYSVV